MVVWGMNGMAAQAFACQLDVKPSFHCTLLCAACRPPEEAHHPQQGLADRESGVDAWA